METIATRLNYLPNRIDNAIDFNTWFKTYIYHIKNLFGIFCNNLYTIEPFSNMDLNDKKLLERFAIYLYKKSSRVI